MSKQELHMGFHEVEESGDGEISLNEDLHHQLHHLQETIQRKETPPPAAFASEASGPGAFHARPRGASPSIEFTDYDETTGTAQEPNLLGDPTPLPAFAIEGELVAASPVEESQPNVGEVYKAEPIETNPRKKYGLMKWALVFLSFGIIFVAAALVFRKGDTQIPSEKSSSNYPDFSDHAVFTRHLVFLGTLIPSVCNTSDISVTITCESDNAILFLDKPNPISRNVADPWVFTRQQQALCTQEQNNELSYISFTCAWMGNETSLVVSVQMNEIQVGCRNSDPDSSVIAGISLGHLCPGHAQRIEYNKSAAKCPATPRGGGCIAQQKCNFCSMPSWAISEPLEDHESCSWDSSIMSDASTNANGAFEDLDVIVESNRGFYKENPTTVPTASPRAAPADLVLTIPPASVAVFTMEPTSSVPCPVMATLVNAGDDDSKALVGGPTWSYASTEPIAGDLRGYGEAIFQLHMSGISGFYFPIEGFYDAAAYEVTLGFAENALINCEKGMRVFSVEINDEVIVDQLDEAGCNTALFKTHTLSPVGGVFNMTMIGLVGNPLLSLVNVRQIGCQYSETKHKCVERINLIDAGDDSSKASVKGSVWSHGSTERIAGDLQGYDEGLFRLHMSGNSGFTIPIEGLTDDVEYEIVLGFAENARINCGVGKRIFSVEVNSEVVVDRLDIFAEAGCNTAIFKTFSRKPVDGVFDVTMIGHVENPLLSMVDVKLHEDVAGCNFQFSPVHGGRNGLWFNDEVIFDAYPRVTKVTIKSGGRLDAIGISLMGGASVMHGGQWGDLSELLLEADEFLVSAETCSSGQSNSIYFISLVTNQGNELSGGTRGGSCVTFTAPGAKAIVGFHGREGDTLESIGAIYFQAPAAR